MNYQSLHVHLFGERGPSIPVSDGVPFTLMNSVPSWLLRWSAATLPRVSGAELGPYPLQGSLCFRTPEGMCGLDLASGKILDVTTNCDAWIEGTSEDFEGISRGELNAQALVTLKQLTFGGEIRVLHMFASLVSRGEKLL